MSQAYGILTETVHTPLSLAGLDARDNIQAKFDYIDRHIEKKEAELETTRLTANSMVRYIRRQLSDLEPNPSDTSEMAEMRRVNQEVTTELLATFEAKLRYAIQRQDDFMDRAREFRMAYANKENNNNYEHLEHEVMPDMVEYIMEFSSD
jgi:hypothetical protein